MRNYYIPPTSRPPKKEYQISSEERVFLDTLIKKGRKLKGDFQFRRMADGTIAVSFSDCPIGKIKLQGKHHSMQILTGLYGPENVSENIYEDSPEKFDVFIDGIDLWIKYIRECLHEASIEKKRAKHMSLARCPECNKKVSIAAFSCPHCGFIFRAYNQIDNMDDYIYPKKKSKAFRNFVVVIVVVLAFCAIVIATQNSPSTPQSDAKANNPQNSVLASKRSILGETMDLSADQEIAMAEIFASCGIGEIVSARALQEGRHQTSYHLRDEETKYYQNPIVVFVNNTTKTVDEIYYGNSFGDFDIYLENAVVSNVTNYYVTSTERAKYIEEVIGLAGEAVNRTDAAMLKETWTYKKDNGNISVLCEKYDFQVIFNDKGEKTSVTYHGYELLKIP